MEIPTEREENQLFDIATFLADEARGSYHIERVFGFLEDYYDDKDVMTRYLFTHRPTAFAFKMKFY
ncbi:MAG: hypothetical protein EOP89_07840 [Lysobacteraceae bacterium]|nr:MAG: hypothetical protein EOP89_07840 [Xanthomonadaceae bacterium]